MKIPIYNKTGKTTQELEFPKIMEKIGFSHELIHQVITVQQKNQRHVWAHTKDRSEVRGGGKKPWRQKGTGRARHGSIRSPIWKGGGVTFGPRKERQLKKRVNHKMKIKAFQMVLAEKIHQKVFFIIQDLDEKNIKTKILLSIFNKLPNWQAKDSCLLVYQKEQKNIQLAARNLKNVSLVTAQNLNTANMMNVKNIVATQKAVQEILRRLQKPSS
jgi:large subunit ribosomal protein L4